jgi:cysteinyl-tRNA synthetase
MALAVRNTLTNRIEEFEPLQPGKVGMYVCGPTVYNYFHIGNARPFVVFDVIRRYLEVSGYDVTFVQNVTDVDDKIIQRARDEGTTSDDIASRYTDAYFEDIEALGVKRATHNPRATATIPGIIDLVRTLESRGMTYTVDGDVYFRVDRFQGYGKLSGKDVNDLRTGAGGRTGDEASRKEHPADFALWKAQKADDEPAWESPWGMGRPGWHIECSAMSMGLLGHTFDIHAGGEDLVFPHHENEIAQSEAATGKPFVRYWLHNGFLNIAKEETPLTPEQRKLVERLESAVAGGSEAERDAAMAELNAANIYVQVGGDGTISFKASKSLGNVPRVREVFERGYNGQVVRFFLLRAHYRGPITFSWAQLDDAKAQLARWAEARRRLAAAQPGDGDGTSLIAAADAAEAKFRAAMDDDFTTPGAIAAAFELIGAANKALSAAQSPPAEALARVDAILGTIEAALGLDFSESDTDGGLADDEQAMLDARAEARKSRNFAESDRLRDELKARGIVVQDGPDGQSWHRE